MSVNLLIASIVLTVIAAGLLLMAILPGQKRLLAQPMDVGTATGGTATATAEATRVAAVRLAMVTGVFNLLWATVVVLMIVRPGSTTGA